MAGGAIRGDASANLDTLFWSAINASFGGK
jgi:hypothetical protein